MEDIDIDFVNTLGERLEHEAFTAGRGIEAFHRLVTCSCHVNSNNSNSDCYCGGDPVSELFGELAAAEEGFLVQCPLRESRDCFPGGRTKGGDQKLNLRGLENPFGVGRKNL